MRLIGNKAFAAVFLFLLSFFVFFPSLRNNFVWDDVEVIEKSYYSFKTSNITSILVPKEQTNKRARYYRPLFYISMVADKNIWGVTPFGFHLSNILFHSISTVLFYFLALIVLSEFRIERKEAGAFFSSLFFVLHPMHVESVSWVAGRTDVLCGLFFLAAFIFHVLSYRKLAFLVLAAISFSLSLLSKEVAVVFPIVVIGFDLVSRRFKSRSNVLKYIVYAALILLYFYLRGRAFVNIPEVSTESIQKSAYDSSQTGEIFKIWEISSVLLNSYLLYIYKLVFPFEFNAFIATVPRDFYYLISSVFVILVLCIVAFASIRNKESITAFSILWVFATLGPSSLVAIFGVASTPLAERYLYVPSSGYCILLGYLVLEAGKRFPMLPSLSLPRIPRMKTQRIGWVFAVLISLSYLFFTIERQDVWKSNLALWEDTSGKSPHHALPHTNYGLALRDAGRGDEAIRELLIALDPRVKDTETGRAITANNLGLVYMDKEDYKSAERWFRKALDYEPGYGRTYYHLGLIYFIRGEYGDTSAYRTAEEYLKKTLKIYSSYGRAHLLLAKVYIRLGENEKAKEQAKKALQSGLIEPLSKETQDILNINNKGSN